MSNLAITFLALLSGSMVIVIYRFRQREKTLEAANKELLEDIYDLIVLEGTKAQRMVRKKWKNKIHDSV